MAGAAEVFLRRWPGIRPGGIGDPVARITGALDASGAVVVGAAADAAAAKVFRRYCFGAYVLDDSFVVRLALVHRGRSN